MALPFLDAMVPAFAAAAALAPRRLGCIYVPNGVNIFKWAPKGEGGRISELSQILSPLEPFRDQLIVPMGLAHRMAESMGDGNGEHSRASAVFLNGVHPKRTEGADVRAGLTIDQIAADHLGQETPLPSLEVALENSFVVGNCDNGYSCVYSNTISWRTPTTPLPMEHNPRVVFERLFGEGGNAAQRLARMQEDRSILDAVTEELAGLQRTLGVGDRTRMDQYLESVREIERRIQTAEAKSGESTLPALLERPVGIPEKFDEHAKLMYDLLGLAYQADITRVSTFLIGREQTNQAYPEIGVPDPHHSMSHHGHHPDKLEKYAKIGTYHVQLLAYFLDKMRSTPDGDGTLLDHSMILYGSGISDGDQHSHVDLPLVLAGGVLGTSKGGRQLHHPAYTPMSNLFVAMLDKLGIPAEKFGDSTGELELEPLSGL
jgi:hypothetical protein